MIRAHDWAATPLGRAETWPQSLRSVLSICLNSSFTTAIYWGPELRLLYNDAWAPILAERHPWALGRPGAAVWSDIWPVVGPQFEGVIERGEGLAVFDQWLPMMRGGVRQDTYWDYSFTPIRGEDGSVVGVFNQGHETTGRVLRERQGRFLLDVSDRLRSISDPRAVIAAAQEALGLHLDANRVGYGEVEESARYFTTDRNWTDGSVPSREGTHDLAGFGPDVLAALRSGTPLVIQDAANDPRTNSPESLAAFDAIDTRAVITASLVKDGHMRAALYVHARESRPWTTYDAELVTEVAERTWGAVERARAETEAKASEERLHESEERLRLAAQAAQIGTWDLDLVTGTGNWDEAAIRISGLGDETGSYDASTWLRIVHPSDREEADSAFRASLEKDGPAYIIEFRGAEPAADGGTRWLTSHGAVLTDPVTGEAARAVGILRDTTARHRQEERLRESEARLRTITNVVPAFVWFATSDGQLHYLNDRWFEYTGQAVEEALPDGWSAALHPDDAERTAAVWAEARARGTTYEVEVRYRRYDGAYRWYVSRAEPFRDAPGSTTTWFGTSTDIHDRKLAEARLRELNETLEQRVAERTSDLTESQRRFRGIFDSALQFMALLTPAGTVVEVNETALKWSQIEPSDIIGTPFWLAAPMRGNPQLQEAIRAGIRRAAGGEIVREEHEMRGAGEVRAIVDFSLKPVLGERGVAAWLVAEGRDITELKRAQDALRQAQKLEAVGQLTGGVAHDFNNLLTIIRSSTDLLRKPDLSEERRRRYVEAISDTVDRASRLTGQLLAFARRQALKPEVFDVAERLRTVTEMLRTIVGARIQIETEIVCGACFVEADASQFETALVNMVVNARDAMNGEGKLTVMVEPIPEIPAIRGHAGGRGQFVAVSIEDTGYGIPADNLALIFEPFFTTKELGKGTGLGLSQVFGFAKQSGGDVAVESRVGQGTVFTLYLPQTDAAGEANGPLLPVAVEPTENGRGRRVLVVEDNVEIGKFSTQILQDLGYETVWAANANEALRILAEANAFDAVFSDVMMPGRSGIELGQEIRSLYPDLPVVLTSGYSHVLAEEGRHGFELLQKPYAAEELSRVLIRVIRGRRKATSGDSPS